MYSVYKFLDDDSITDLAVRMNTTVDELERLNGFSDFSSGDLVVVPNNDIYITYSVKNGDTIYSISKRYDQDVDTLYAINGIKEGDFVYPGQQLLIPNKNVIVYSTHDGDTVGVISDYMDVSVSDIINSNPNLVLMPDQLVVYKK